MRLLTRRKELCPKKNSFYHVSSLSVQLSVYVFFYTVYCMLFISKKDTIKVMLLNKGSRLCIYDQHRCFYTGNTQSL